MQIPEFLKVGSIVRNRSRLWRVDAVDEDIIAVSAIDGTTAERHRFYFPVETFEQGKLPQPKPDMLGNPAAQDLMVRAFKLSLIHGTAPLISLQHSSVIPTEYQLIPILMALDLPRVRMLLADDIGLGKTIEAGLIITELLGRQRISRILIVTPASLREQWREAMDHFFHIEFRIISTRHRRTLERELPPGANPWEYYPYLITSLDYAKKPEVRNFILEQKWDLVLFDEAHHVAKPHQSSERDKVTMDRWEFTEAIARHEHITHLLFLTATPHNGYRDTYASLLKMLVPEGVSGPIHNPVIHRDILHHHVCQRRRKDVDEWFETGKALGFKSPFKKRDQIEVFQQPSGEQVKAIEKIVALGDHILSVVREGTVYQRHMANWTVMHFHKRAISSPKALRESLNNRINTIQEKLMLKEEESVTGITEEEVRANVLDEDPGEKVDDEEVSHRTDRSIFGDLEALKRELKLLEEALEFAEKITPLKDFKLQDLMKNLLHSLLREFPKVLIFTRWKDTLDYLQEQLSEHPRFKSMNIVTLFGNIDESIRSERIKEFTNVKSGILIATDCISEGMNLQYASNQLIHYELPWNPNRLEQRNGRVDRFGQPLDKVVIRTLIMNDTLEADIARILVEKARQIREDYGFSPPFFGDETSIIELIREHKPSYKYGPGQRTLDEFLAEKQEHLENPFARDVLEQIQGDSFYGGIEIGLGEVQQRLDYTYKLIGRPEEIEKFVKLGLTKYGCKLTETNNKVWTIELSDEFSIESQLVETLEGMTFDPQRAFEDPSLEVIDLGHPIVQKLIEKVKFTSFNDPEFYGRSAALKKDCQFPVSTIFQVLGRYIVGTKPPSIIEELFEFGIEVFSGKELSPEMIKAIEFAERKPLQREESEIKADLKRALENPLLDQFLQNQADLRCRKIVDERIRMKAKMQDEAPKEWLNGVEDVTIASYDMIAVTLYYPTIGE